MLELLKRNWAEKKNRQVSQWQCTAINTATLLGLFGLTLILMLGCGLTPVMSTFQHCYSTLLHICKNSYKKFLCSFWPDPSRFIRLASSLKWLHLLTAIDQFTRWTKAIPLTNIRAEKTAHALCWLLDFTFSYSIKSDNWSLTTHWICSLETPHETSEIYLSTN